MTEDRTERFEPSMACVQNFDDNFSPFHCSTSKWDLFADDEQEAFSQEATSCDRNADVDSELVVGVEMVEDGPILQQCSSPVASAVTKRASLPASIIRPPPLHATLQAPTKRILKRRWSHPLAQQKVP